MKMIWFWLIVMVVICVGGGIGQCYWNKHHPNATHSTFSDDNSDTESWEGY